MKKKLSKHKVKLVKAEKAKRKEKNKKLNKNKKIISKRKFEINGGKGYKKYIEDFWYFLLFVVLDWNLFKMLQ